MEALLGIDLVTLVKTAGYAGMFFIIFAESGLFFGFFFPGDSLLFTAGFLASQVFLNIIPLATLTFVAAILGDNVGYAFGKKVGVKIFKREDSLLFHKDHLIKAQQFYAKYGGKTIVLARFIPIVRTFAPIVAGAGEMKYSQFLFYNFIGGTIWGLGMPLLGYFLGSAIPGIDQYLIPIVLVIIVVSFLPPVWEVLKDRDSRRQVGELIRKSIGKIFGKSS